MPLREDILKPISEENRCGVYLRHAPLYDKVKEIRRENWDQVKTADYAKLRDLTETAIATQSKDLQIAVWLAEALIYDKHAEGLCDGLQLLIGLITDFWDGLYPPMDVDDPGFRTKHVDWLGNYFDPAKGSSPSLAVRHLPVTKSKLDWFQYKESLTVPTEAEAQESENKAQARISALAEKKLSPEQFNAAFRETPKAFYRAMQAGLQMAAELLIGLDGLCQQKFGKDAPSFGALRKAIEEVGNSARILLQEKLEQDPDPVPVAEVSVDEVVEADDTAETTGVQAVVDGGEVAALATDLRSREDAVRLLVLSAQFLRRASPADPVSYLMLRALRWGELRMGKVEALGTLLDAPRAEVRRALKYAAQTGDWMKVLEIAEGAAATECGRGWLDLHRYTIQACEAKAYPAVAQALRSGLKALLSDFPSLPQMTLADDTGTANPETMSWLIREGLFKPTEENSGG